MQSDVLINAFDEDLCVPALLSHRGPEQATPWRFDMHSSPLLSAALCRSRDSYEIVEHRRWALSLIAIPPGRVALTECFGAQEVDIYFLNNIFNLKGNCVLRTLKNSFAIF